MKPSADKRLPRPLFFWVALLLGLLMLAVYCFTGWLAFRYGTLVKDAGWTAIRTQDSWFVQRVDPSGPAAGKLQAGEQIVAINGDTRAGKIDPFFKLQFLHDSYTVRVTSGSTTREQPLNFVLRHDVSNLVWVLPLTVVSLAFYVIGMLMGLLKPGDPATRMGFAFSLACAVHMLGLALIPMRNVLSGPALTLSLVTYSVSFFQYALGYHFSSRFPTSSSENRYWIALRYCIYILCTLLFLPRTTLNLLPVLGQETAMAFHYRHSQLIDLYLDQRFTYEGLFQLLAIGAMSAVFARNYRQAQGADQLRRMKWLAFGVAAGLAPLGVYAVVLLFLNLLSYQQFLQSVEWTNITRLVNIVIIVIPITVGYAVIKHRVLGINIVIRRWLQYLLAKNVLRLALFLPLIGFAYRVIHNRHRTVTDVLSANPWPFYSFLIVTAGVSLKYHSQLQGWLDRKFFREAHDQEMTLSALIERIKELDSMSAISELVSTELESTLHPKRIYVFYRKEESSYLVLGYSSEGQSPDLVIPEDYLLVQNLEGRKSIQETPFIKIGEIPDNERDWLEQMGIHLIVPILGTTNRLVGMLLLGEKKSEEPYTWADRNLLQAITGQMAVVWDNRLLRERVTREQKIRYEVLAKLDKNQINLLKECPLCGECFDQSVQQCPTDGKEVVLTLPVERTVEQRYRLDRRLGRGGTSAVYEATDLRLSRKVAIKIMMGNLLGNATALRRFERGAQASAKLSHSNIITVYDYGVIRGTEGAFLVMELLPGRTWRFELKKVRAFDPAVAAQRFEQLLEGLNSAHLAGVIHRDLKPENVLITTHESGPDLIKILDFGLAKMKFLDASDTNTLTATGMVMGTLGYMSPEQLTGENVDERSDIYSVGVMIVEALTGARPFSGHTISELRASMFHENFHLNGESKEVADLDLLVQRCIALNRDARFATVKEMQEAVIPAIRKSPTLAVFPSDQDALTTSMDEPHDILPP